MLTVAEIGREIGARVEGDGNVAIRGCAGLEEAGPGEISFLADPKGFGRARESRAGALILPEGTEGLDRPVLRVANPRLAFAQVLALFAPEPAHPQGRHPTAVVHPDAELAEDVALGPYVVVEAGAEIGPGVRLYAGVYIGARAVVGEGTVIYPNVVVREDVRIGRRCTIHAGAVIGADGFGYVTVDGWHQKVPQIGTVEIGDDVEIGALTAIDRATCGATRIGRGTKIDNLVMVAHNVQVGEACLVAGLSGLAGSARLGDRVVMAGQAALADHAEVGNGAVLAARTGVFGKAPGNMVLSGFPARPHGEAMRIMAATQRLPELVKTVRELSARVAGLEAALAAMEGRDGQGGGAGGGSGASG